MTRRTPEKLEPPSQSERFEQVARALGCDEDEAAFKERLGKLLAVPVKKDAPKPTPKKARKPA